jgi:transcriptional regulator with XRE-family HTH domain
MNRRRVEGLRAALPRLLREIRAEAGLSQVALAKRIRRPQSFVSKYETGARRLDVAELFEICAACGVTLSRFGARLEHATDD